MSAGRLRMNALLFGLFWAGVLGIGSSLSLDWATPDRQVDKTMDHAMSAIEDRLFVTWELFQFDRTDSIVGARLAQYVGHSVSWGVLLQASKIELEAASMRLYWSFFAPVG